MKKRDYNFYGVGIEWHANLERSLLNNIHQFGCYEFIPENFFYGQGMSFLEELRKSQIPVIVHGVELSFGTDEPLKEEHLRTQLEIAERVNTAMFSDHLAMTEAGGVEIGQLTPLPWTQECVDSVSRKIEKIQTRCPYPFMIENITNRFIIPECELSETEFINTLLRRTGCGLLLDLNNVHTNATNFKFDPIEWLEQIDLSAVTGIHLAGGVYDYDGTLLDSHDNTVPEEVWRLFRWVCERHLPSSTIVERTSNIPEFTDLLGEVKRAEQILSETHPEIKVQELHVRAPQAQGVSL